MISNKQPVIGQFWGKWALQHWYTLIISLHTEGSYQILAVVGFRTQHSFEIIVCAMIALPFLCDINGSTSKDKPFYKWQATYQKVMPTIQSIGFGFQLKS